MALQTNYINLGSSMVFTLNIDNSSVPSYLQKDLLVAINTYDSQSYYRNYTILYDFNQTQIVT